VTIAFGCDPKRLEDLVARVYQEVDTYKKDGPTAKEVADEREALNRDLESSLKQNGFWLGQLVNKYDYGEDPATILSIGKNIGRIDAAAITAAANTYLKGDNRVQLTLVPESR